MSKKCTNCEGEGYYTEECDKCGSEIEVECEECGGRGEVEEEEEEEEGEE